MDNGSRYGSEGDNRGSDEALELFGAGGETSPFDRIRHQDERGEYWTAREMQPFMDYTRWESFADVVEKAKASLALVEGADAAQHHFGTWGSDGGRWGNQRLDDYRLTRFGAYLTAMAGDDNKEAVAQARIYFAIKTREAETAVPQPRRELTNRELAMMVLEEADRADKAEARAKAVEQRNAELLPKAEQAEQHRAADGLKSVGDFANDVKAWAKRTHGVVVKHKQVWDHLARLKLIIRGNTVRHNHPTAFAVENDYVRAKETTFERARGFEETSVSPRLTPAGEGYAWDRITRFIAEHGSLELD